MTDDKFYDDQIAQIEAWEKQQAGIIADGNRLIAERRLDRALRAIPSRQPGKVLDSDAICAMFRTKVLGQR